MDALSELYSLLREEDMWAGLWQKKAKYAETNIAIAYEQQGFYEQSQVGYHCVFCFYSKTVQAKTGLKVRTWQNLRACYNVTIHSLHLYFYTGAAGAHAYHLQPHLLGYFVYAEEAVSKQ